MLKVTFSLSALLFQEIIYPFPILDFFNALFIASIRDINSCLLSLNYPSFLEGGSLATSFAESHMQLLNSSCPISVHGSTKVLSF